MFGRPAVRARTAANRLGCSATARPLTTLLPDMALYSYWRSSCSYRVRIVLAHKGLLEKVEYRPVHLVKDGGEQLRTEYTTLNKFAQVPTLAVGGSSITQSLAIIEYLEEVYPTPSILPGDALDRAAARQFAECINSGIQPLQVGTTRHCGPQARSSPDSSSCAGVACRCRT